MRFLDPWFMKNLELIGSTVAEIRGMSPVDVCLLKKLIQTFFACLIIFSSATIMVSKMFKVSIAKAAILTSQVLRKTGPSSIGTKPPRKCGLIQTQ